MTRRDLCWRLAGAVMAVGGCLAGMFHHPGSPLTVLYFSMTLAGLGLLHNGKRLAVALKAELRGHPHTANVIHARRTGHQPPHR